MGGGVVPQISGDQMSANKARRAPLNVLFFNTALHSRWGTVILLGEGRQDEMWRTCPAFVSTAFMIDMAWFEIIVEVIMTWKVQTNLIPTWLSAQLKICVIHSWTLTSSVYVFVPPHTDSIPSQFAKKAFINHMCRHQPAPPAQQHVDEKAD